MGKTSGVLGVLAAAGMMIMLHAAPAKADTPRQGCERVPLFGLNPQVREICDTPIQPDGSWIRFRQFWHPQYVHSTCFGEFYQGGCANWAKDSRDVNPEYRGPVEQYVVTPGTVPEGEPGHLE